MRVYLALLIGAGFLVLGGVLQGYFSHRWDAWSENDSAVSRERLTNAVPLVIGDWVGERLPNETLDLPEELVGLGVVTKFVDKTDGTTVIFYLGYGPTNSIIVHTPPVCYQANGYKWVRPDLHQSVGPQDQTQSEFWISQFSIGEQSSVPVYLRVLWAFRSVDNWQVPSNPGRTYRSYSKLYKCYAIRQLTSLQEPTNGDPCLRLLELLLPKVDENLRQR